MALTSAEVLGACAANQDDEIMSLESIYGSDMMKKVIEEKKTSLTFTIEAALVKEKLTIHVQGTTAMDVATQTFSVEHLPPVYLDVVLPGAYPEIEPPRFLLRSVWLTPAELGRLCKNLEDIWEENKGMTVLFLWIEFLEKELLSFLEIEDLLNLQKLIIFQQKMAHSKVWRPSYPSKSRGDKLFDKRVQTIALSPEKISSHLREFNEKRKRELFDARTFECSICLCTLAGKDMTIFGECDHAFCNICTKEQFITQIKDGCPSGVITCMEPGCKAEASITDVKRLIGEELSRKYDDILFRRCITSMSDITMCPRNECQKPVIIDSNELGMCATCGFNFCLSCKRASHGLNPCRLVVGEYAKVITDYLKGSQTERQALETKYSKRFLNALVEEHHSQLWLKNNATACPECKQEIEKSEGCNKMTCWHCQTKFCYICGKNLNGLVNPYSHYSDQRAACRLFEGMEDEDGDHVDDDDDDDLAWAFEGEGGRFDFGVFENVNLIEDRFQ